MKAIMLLSSMFLFTRLTFAQHVGVGIGTTLLNVRFESEEDPVKHNLESLPGATASVFFIKTLGQSEDETSLNIHQVYAEAGYKSGRVTDEADQLLSIWSLHHLSCSFVYRYTRILGEKANPFLGGGAAYDHLLEGTQSQGFMQYDLTDHLTRSNVSAIAEAGVAYHISEDSFATFSLSWSGGLANVERDVRQKAYLNSIKLSLATFFKLN